MHKSPPGPPVKWASMCLEPGHRKQHVGGVRGRAGWHSSTRCEHPGREGPRPWLIPEPLSGVHAWADCRSLKKSWLWSVLRQTYLLSPSYSPARSSWLCHVPRLFQELLILLDCIKPGSEARAQEQQMGSIQTRWVRARKSQKGVFPGDRQGWEPRPAP